MLSEFITSRHTLQEMLKEIFQAEWKWCQMEVLITQSEWRRKETGTMGINVRVSGCCRFLSFWGALCNVKQVDANVKQPSWWFSPFELTTSFMSLGHYDRPFAFLIPKFSTFVTSPIVSAISPRTGAHIPSVAVYQKQMKYTYNV